MDILKIIFYFVWAGLAVFCIHASTTTNREMRSRLLIIYFIVLFVCLPFSFMLGKNGILLTLGLGGSWPLFVAALLNQQPFMPSIVFSRPRMNKFLLLLLGVGVLMLVFIYVSDFVNNFPALTTANLDNPLHHDYIELVRFQFILLMSMLPAMLAYAIKYLQRTMFSLDGVVTEGVLAPWSEFKSYRWVDAAGKDPYVELVLEPKPYGWLKQASYPLSIQDKERLDPVLQQKLYSSPNT